MHIYYSISIVNMIFIFIQNSFSGVVVGGSMNNMVLFNQAETRKKSCSF